MAIAAPVTYPGVGLWSRPTAHTNAFAEAARGLRYSEVSPADVISNPVAPRVHQLWLGAALAVASLSGTCTVVGQSRPLSWKPVQDVGSPHLLPTEPPLIAAGGYTKGLMSFSCISVCADTVLVNRPPPIQREALRVLRAAFGSCRVQTEETLDPPLFVKRGPGTCWPWGVASNVLAQTLDEWHAAQIDRAWEDQLSSENPAFEALSDAEREPPLPGSMRAPVVKSDPWGYAFPPRPKVSKLLRRCTFPPDYRAQVLLQEPWVSSSRYCTLCKAF